MAEPPKFFVPNVGAGEQEVAYAALARRCSCSPPVGKDRIYSITYVHDSEEWTATVGKPLQGTKRKTTRSKGKKIEREERVSDPATVVAIFSGNPYLVVTDKGVNGVRSAWENPFMAGKPHAVTFFSAAS